MSRLRSAPAKFPGFCVSLKFVNGELDLLGSSQTTSATPRCLLHVFLVVAQASDVRLSAVVMLHTVSLG